MTSKILRWFYVMGLSLDTMVYMLLLELILIWIWY